jgi:hypothetical protein
VVLSLLWFVCCITFMYLHMLKHPCILGMKPNWSWCMIFLTGCWVKYSVDSDKSIWFNVWSSSKVSLLNFYLDKLCIGDSGISSVTITVLESIYALRPLEVFVCCCVLFLM